MSGTRQSVTRQSGHRPGITVNTSETNENGNGTQNEENPMAKKYFLGQYAHNSSPFISAEEQARRQEEIYNRQFENNEDEMNNMLDNALKYNDFFFNSEEYERLVNTDKFLRRKLKMEAKNSYSYPPSFFKRLIRRCIGKTCEKVEVLVPPPKPGHYPNRKQRKANTRKSNTRKSNTRKRSNF